MELAAGILSAGGSVLIIARALSLRRTLVDRPYRSRALWMAWGGLSVVFLVLATSYGNLANTLGGVHSSFVVSSVLVTVSWGVAIIGLFGWMVTNVDVALDADFFHRDAVYWRRGGGVAALIAAVALYVFDSAAGLVSGPEGEPIGPWFATLVNAVVTVLYLIIIVYAFAATVLAYTRIEDRAVKAYMRWVAFSFAALLATGVLWSTLGPTTLPVMVYLMYRAAGALSLRVRALGP